MIEILPQRCQPFLYKRSGCRLCVDACPEGCIEFKDNLPSVNGNLCTLCGICTGVCPSSALRVEGFDDLKLWERLKGLTEGKEGVVFTCAPQGEGLKSVRLKTGSSLIALPCVGILKDCHLTGLFLNGVKEVWLKASCKDCSSLQGRAVLEKTLSYTRNILNIFSIDGEIVLSEDFPSYEKDSKKVRPEEIIPAPHYSRREFLNVFREKAKGLKGSGVDNEEEREGQEFLPEGGETERRALFLELFGAINKPSTSIIEKGLLPFKELSVSEDCTLCRICDLFCPTNAIERVENAGDVRLNFTISRCVGCLQCEELCPEGAIASYNAINLKSILDRETNVLYKKEKAVCPSCNKLYLPREGMNVCLSCKKKMDIERAFFEMNFYL